MSTEPTLPAPGFLDPRSFALTELLETNHAAIKAELMEVLHERAWSPYLDHDERLGRALLFLLYVRGRPNPRNCRRCPRTASLLATIPNMRQAIFGFLPARARIAPHRGAPGILRVHLGLLAEPGKAGWRVEGRTRHCVEGKVTIFDDGALHEAWNEGDGPRVTLICDPPTPGLDPDGVRQTLQGYERRYGLGYLLRTFGKRWPPSHPWNRLAQAPVRAMDSWARRLEPRLLPAVLFGYNRFSARFAALPRGR